MICSKRLLGNKIALVGGVMLCCSYPLSNNVKFVHASQAQRTDGSRNLKKNHNNPTPSPLPLVISTPTPRPTENLPSLTPSSNEKNQQRVGSLQGPISSTASSSNSPRDASTNGSSRNFNNIHSNMIIVLVAVIGSVMLFGFFMISSRIGAYEERKRTQRNKKNKLQTNRVQFKQRGSSDGSDRDSQENEISVFNHTDPIEKELTPPKRSIIEQMLDAFMLTTCAATGEPKQQQSFDTKAVDEFEPELHEEGTEVIMAKSLLIPVDQCLAVDFDGESTHHRNSKSIRNQQMKPVAATAQRQTKRKHQTRPPRPSSSTIRTSAIRSSPADSCHRKEMLKKELAKLEQQIIILAGKEKTKNQGNNNRLIVSPGDASSGLSESTDVGMNSFATSTSTTVSTAPTIPKVLSIDLSESNVLLIKRAR